VNYFKKHKEGFLLTILFHTAILLILFNLGFFTPLPLPEEKGVLVDFGDNDAGIGKKEPAPKAKPMVKEMPVKAESDPVVPPSPQPEPQQKPEPAAPVTPPNAGVEELMTQDFEKTVALDEGKKKEEELKKKKEEELKKKKEEELQKQLAEKLKNQKEAEEKKHLEDLEKERQQKLEQQKIAAAEKRVRDSLQRVENARLAELKRIEDARLAEMQRLAEVRRQDSIQKAKDNARINAINSLAENAFGGASGQNDQTSDSNGQGVTYGSGNQGSSTGTPGTEQYGLGGGEGISFNLSGRSAERLQKPTYPGQEEGIVVVQITVDKFGKVTKANPGVRGSTSLEQGLLNAAKTAALSTHFNEDVNAPAFQTGTITYRFVLD
jgi:TolA protein